MVLTSSACSKKEYETNDILLRDIPASTATQEEPEEEPENDEVEIDDEYGVSTNNPDRTEDSDRDEIESNLRDAKNLIEAGEYEDAAMIIKSLQTRPLTSSEKNKLKELQKMMIKISD